MNDSTAKRRANAAMSINAPGELPSGPLHVFAYGSLLWRPGFTYTDAVRGHIFGFHRALRVWSFHHRGTNRQPGLVLGLDRGGSCVGWIYEVAAANKLQVAEYLWAREMITAVYRPCLIPVRIHDQWQSVLAFVIDRAHEQYAGALPAREAARHIATASGQSGDNTAYVRATVRGLTELGIRDHGLSTVLYHLDNH